MMPRMVPCSSSPAPLLINDCRDGFASDEPKASTDQPGLAQPAHQGMDEHSLHHDTDTAHEAEHPPHAPLVHGPAVFGDQGEGELHHGEGQGGREGEQDGQTHDGVGEPAPYGEARQPTGMDGAFVHRTALREAEPRPNEVYRRERGGQPYGSSDPEDGQLTAHPGAEGEPDPEGRADETHPSRPVRGRSDVSDVRLGGGDVGGEGAMQQPEQEQQPERLRQGEGRQGKRGSTDGQEHDGPPTVTIRQRAPYRRKRELGERIDPEERDGLSFRGAVILGIEGDERDHQAEAQQVEENRQQDRPQTPAGAFSVFPLGQRRIIPKTASCNAPLVPQTPMCSGSGWLKR
ncbi:MAG: hypothetical protein JRI25_13035 [Deltaproteobacteria bacterium]|nr:hypothetical protein [Deltaproteobacteria bacterium]